MTSSFLGAAGIGLPDSFGDIAVQEFEKNNQVHIVRILLRTTEYAYCNFPLHPTTIVKRLLRQTKAPTETLKSPHNGRKTSYSTVNKYVGIQVPTVTPILIIRFDCS